MKARLALAVPLLLGLTLLTSAADWPQWRGPKRDNLSTEKGLLKTWPKDGPKLLWTYSDAGIGYSCPAVVGDRLYLQGARGDSEYVYALNLKSTPPTEAWSAKVGPTFNWKGNTWNAGPCASPTVDGSMVYALGGQGDLVCVGTADGTSVVWRKSLPRDLGGEVNPIGGGAKEPTPLGWGYAGSPLVDGENLVCVPGGKQGLVAALNKKTGALVWQSKELPEQASYSSPLVAEVGGVRQYLQLTYDGVAGVAAKDGKLLWYAKRKRPYSDVLIPTPLFHDNHVFTTSGHGGVSMGCDLIKLTPGKEGIAAATVYGNRNLANSQGGVVLVGEHVYGYGESQGWVCLELKSGDLKWKEKGALGRGSVTYADGCLYCLGEDEGTVVLVEASPDGWKELGRFTLPQKSKSELRQLRGKVWTTPIIADGKLYLRDQELLFCYDIKGK